MKTSEQRNPLLTILVDLLARDTGAVSADLLAVSWGAEGRLVGTDPGAAAALDLLPAQAARALGRRLQVTGTSGIDGWALARPPADEEDLLEVARRATGLRLHRSMGFSPTCPCLDDHPHRALAERTGAYHRRRLSEAQRTALGQAIAARQWVLWPASGMAAVERVRARRSDVGPPGPRGVAWEGLLRDLADLALAEAAVAELGPEERGPGAAPAAAAWEAVGRVAVDLGREAARAVVEPVEALVRRSLGPGS